MKSQLVESRNSFEAPSTPMLKEEEERPLLFSPRQKLCRSKTLDNEFYVPANSLRNAAIPVRRGSFRFNIGPNDMQGTGKENRIESVSRSDHSGPVRRHSNNKLRKASISLPSTQSDMPSTSTSKISPKSREQLQHMGPSVVPAPSTGYSAKYAKRVRFQRKRRTTFRVSLFPIPENKPRQMLQIP